MRRMRWSFLLAVGLVGCASAGIGDPAGQSDGNNNGGTDGTIDPPLIDARPIDAAPPPIDAALSQTLQQTANNTVAAANSVTCSNNTTGESRDNSWYRVFALADHGIVNRPFYVTQVTFSVQESAGSPQAQVKVGTYAGTIGAGTLNLAQVTALASANVTIPPTTTGVSVPVPITATIPSNGQVIIEIFGPDLQGTGKHIFIGASTGAETANRPGYIKSATCSIATPQTVAATGFPNSHLIITVTGQY
jgi:hypothetical protein